MILKGIKHHYPPRRYSDRTDSGELNDVLHAAPHFLSHALARADKRRRRRQRSQTKAGADGSQRFISYLIRPKPSHQQSWPARHIKASVGVGAN